MAATVLRRPVRLGATAAGVNRVDALVDDVATADVHLHVVRLGCAARRRQRVALDFVHHAVAADVRVQVDGLLRAARRGHGIALDRVDRVVAADVLVQIDELGAATHHRLGGSGRGAMPLHSFAAVLSSVGVIDALCMDRGKRWMQENQ
eukprot:CAMPEP_0170192892 /NCGR_PEP_ID=MMETSP0040_2-20121228/55509_1 /TAXON_ID=641309 /ORGANISM="Lotharella oceanica, Strain CCMP622" /LENGTH=148 /DNA_ID=CAMNT_0010441371 /DNA_START=499 /DNA_END=942 /DNA_ORIENTATION=-